MPALAQLGPPANGNLVVYTPAFTQQQQGVQPFHTFYDLTIKSPANLASGVYSISMTLIVEEAPTGVDLATSLSFITFVDPLTGLPKNQLAFTGPNQTQTVRVTTDIPVGSNDGNFKYFIKTSGWPSNFTDNGTRINASASLPSGYLPPTVDISAPANGTEYVYLLGGPAVPVVIEVAGAASSSAPLHGLVASLSGEDEAGVPFLINVPLSLVLNGLGTPDAVGVVTMPVTRAGLYTIVATATNELGSSTTSSIFVVTQSYPPPTVVLDHPSPGSEYTHYLGLAPAVVPFHFTGTSIFGGITALTATIDGEAVVFTPSGLQTLTATGSTNFEFTTVGTHELKVVATNAYGSAEASTYFRVNVISPIPTIAITDPEQSEIFTHIVGTPDLDIAFSFVTSTSAEFTVDAVSAELDGQPLSLASTTGLGTVSALSTGTMSGVLPGEHTLTARGLSSGIPVQTSVTFTVVEAPALVPPMVVINSPADGAIYTIHQGDTQTVTLTFTGTSNYVGGTITGMSAAINGTPLLVTFTTSGKYGYGTATLTLSQGGAHVITVTATDAVGTATAQGTVHVTVTASPTQDIGGTVFFDPNFNGIRTPDEPGLPGVSIQLLDSSGSVLQTTLSSASGQYSFTDVAAGNYLVRAVPVTGLAATTMNDVMVLVQNSAVIAPDIGFGLKFSAINGLSAGGFTIGYWKNNLDKALAGKTKGVQVSKATLQAYTGALGSLALDPFANITMAQAAAVMSDKSSNSANLLAKQLVASEYNYANGAYLSGNRTLTYCFIYWGEYVLKNKASYSSSYLIWAKDWFDAYNNSHGGLVTGPAP